MSLAAADKLLRSFEALKNFKDGISVSESGAVAPNKKKESTLSIKDRINYLNTVGDLTISPLLRNLNEFGKLVAVSIETLLSFCDDEEPDVRLVAGDSINRMIKVMPKIAAAFALVLCNLSREYIHISNSKHAASNIKHYNCEKMLVVCAGMQRVVGNGFMDANVARVHVELYKEIKKNGSPRCIRAALSKFADICHLIRPHKCRPFITNLLPCIARICTRQEDLVQETLATAMKKIFPCLGAFMNDKETKALLKTFLQNFNSLSATTRRTAATSITVVCLHGRNPPLLFSWIINILLQSMVPFSLDQNSSTYCGALLCLRHIVGQLDSEEGDEVVMRGSFGVRHQNKEHLNGDMFEREERQLLKMFEVIMRSTKHTDHNVVTGALEALQQLLLSPPKKLLFRLLSSNGLTSTEESEGSFSAPPFDDLDSLSFSSNQDSGIEEPLVEISVDGATEKCQDSGMSVDDIREMRRHFSQPEDAGTVSDTSSEMSESSIGLGGSTDTDNDSVLGHKRVGSNTSEITTRSSSADDLDVDDQVQQGFPEDNREQEEVEDDTSAGVDDQFGIDPVACRGVPMLHCARVMCSFLLSGRTNEVISDRKVRVSVKSLALGCLAAIFKHYPEAFFARVVPERNGQGTNRDCRGTERDNQGAEGDDQVTQRDDQGTNRDTNGSERDNQGTNRDSQGPEEGTGGEYSQLIRDVLLFEKHHDPQVRGNLAILLANLLEFSLKAARFDFNDWSTAICKDFKTSELTIQDMLNVLENLVVDESSVTVRLACQGLRQCLPYLLRSQFARDTIQLCVKLVQLKRNSYWLVKIELLQIVGDFDFSLFRFLENQGRQRPSGKPTTNSYSLQQTFFNDVVLELLVDSDLRVRTESAKTIINLIPSMFFESDFYKQEPLLVVTKKIIARAMECSSSSPSDTNEILTIQKNLARVVTSLSHQLNTANSKHAVLGCCEALALLSHSYPVSSWPSSWGCQVQANTHSPPPTGKPGSQGTPSSMFSSSPQSSKPIVSSILCNNGGGALAFIVQLMTSSWLTLNLRAHEDALLLVGNLLVGIASSAISLCGGTSGGKSTSTADETTGQGKWTVFCDPSISTLAENVLIHVIRILNICSNVIDNVSPGAHTASKVSLLGKDKDKSPAPIPGAAVPTSSSQPTLTGVASPKKLLHRARKNTDADTANLSGTEKTPTNKAEGEEKKTITRALGQFHHMPHYCKLHEVIKGAFSNYKVNLKFQEDDKFIKLLKTVLKVFAMLLELCTFSDIGKYVEEIIGYLGATVKCEPAATFLCVQQMLRAIFGVNVANQPENSPSNFVSQRDALVTEVHLAPFLEDSSRTFHDAGFYHSFFEEYQQEQTRLFEELRKRDHTKETKSFKDFGFIKKLRQRSGSFRPPLKVDKQVRIHLYIRMFEPLVIQALKEYTCSSDIQTQAQVLSILVQLIRLRVNYALLDSEQAFLNFVLKQFEFIKAGQLRGTELFCPHVFQFLILLSYECFQPKSNQAKSVFGMSRIIQVCDDLMACGQSARTHAIPALRPIVYDLFDLQATGRNENSKELDIQREVFISMLLRLAQFPEILKLIVYVLNFNRKNDDKWKKISRQAVDITLQMLIKQQVLIDDIHDLKSLENLFDAVAPIALRPLDMILKVLFSPAILPNSLLINRWVSQVLVLLKVIITQNSEENILSRISQLGFKGTVIGNIVDNEEPHATDVESESSPDKIFVHFIIHALFFATKNLFVITTEKHFAQDSDIRFASQQISYLLLYIQDLAKSGLFKNISSCFSSTVTEGLFSDDSPRSSDVKVRRINELFILLREIQPVIFLQWLQLLLVLGFEDEEWWTSLHGQIKNKHAELSVTNHICLKGTFLLRCKLLSDKLKHNENREIFHMFIQENLNDLVQMSHEPPVKTLFRQIHSSTMCSQVFIDVVKNESLKGTIQNMHKLEFKKALLVILDDLHYEQSNSLIQLLIMEFLASHYRAITRKCETMICSRLEYCISLPKEEFGSFFSPDDIKSIHNSLVSLGVTKRNPRLSSLISHVSPDPSNVPTVENIIDLENAILAVKNKEPSQMTWYYTFVYNCCCSWKSNEVGIKSLDEVVHLLHALSFEQISKIMDDENFNTALLKPCLEFGIHKTSEYYSHKFDHQTPHNPIEDTSYFDHYGVDHLFQCSFALLLRHVQEIVFSVTTFEETANNGKTTADGGISLITSTMNYSSVEELAWNWNWHRKLLDIVQGVDIYLALASRLHREARMPKSIYCAVCQFGMISLQALCEEKRRSKFCCTSKLTIVLRCFSRMLHDEDLYMVFNSSEYKQWVGHSLRSVDELVKTVFIHPGNDQTEIHPSDPCTDPNDTQALVNQASTLVNYLYTILDSSQSSIPFTLTQTFRDVITGLSRLSVFNSYVRIPPLVWKMGWESHDVEKELPPLPIDILREKDVLQDFVLRVHSIGWISRQQFEETWAALLGVLSSPLLPDESSHEEDIESIKSGCLALQCITALLLQTTLCPLPGNPTIGVNYHTSRHKELPFLGSRAGKKLCAVRTIVENHFLSQSPRRSTLQTNTDEINLYGENIERVGGLHSYSQGQISIAALQTQCSVPPNETDEYNGSNSVSPSLQIPIKEKIDVRSCVQFLMELFERWISPYTQPKTPLMLLTESVKSLLIISDLFVDSAQYESMLSELVDLHQHYPPEDEIMMQYLLPALCKPVAVLKMEGVIPEKIIKIMEISFRAPHVPLQISALYGALYLLESHTSSVVSVVIPLVTEYVQKILALTNDTSVFGEHRLLVLLSTSFYMLEHYESEITDTEFKKTFLKAAIQMASAKDESTPLNIYHAIIRGLERLVVSFSLSREDSDALVKLSVDRLAMRNPQRAISALGLLLTCMYTGKEGDRPGGLFSSNDVIDTPTDDVLLVALERVTSLFDRIRKGFRSEAKLVSEILPIVLGDFFPPQDVMNKVIGEFVSSQQPHPELMADVLYKVCEDLITQGQQKSVKDWVLLSLRSFTQRPPLGMAVWSFSCAFIATSSNKWIRALFPHVVSRIGKLENIDRSYFLITATDFYFNQNLTEEEKQSFKSTFERVAQSGTPYAELLTHIV